MHRDKPDTVHDVNRLLLAVVAVVSLAACGGSSSSSSSSAPERDPATYWTALVAERYGDCFEALGTQGELVFEANKGGASRDGFVLITAPGVVLTFAVGTAPNGVNELTIPHDEETTNALNSCPD